MIVFRMLWFRYSLSIEFSSGVISKTEPTAHSAPSAPPLRGAEAVIDDEDAAASAFALLPLFASAYGGDEGADIEGEAIASFKSRVHGIVRWVHNVVLMSFCYPLKYI
jgi:hypothetical protein